MSLSEAELQETYPASVPASPAMVASVAAVKAYHEQSKHRFSRYANGPDTLDWDNQPNPFRYFSGCETYDLPFPDLKAEPVFARQVADASYPVSKHTLAWFLRYSLAISAWKQFGPDKWSLRINPSSGNLHPTEAYLILDNSTEWPAGLYHFQAEQFLLEKRALLDGQITGFNNGFLLGLTSVTWREAWKYGERGFRYSQLDVGHAISAISHAAAALGWQTWWLKNISHECLAAWLGTCRTDFVKREAEEPECLLHIGPAAPDEKTLRNLVAAPGLQEWQGKANLLSEEPGPYRWPAVDAANANTREHPRGIGFPLAAALVAQGWGDARQAPAALFREVVSSRRSAQRFSNQSVARADLLAIMGGVVNGEQALLDTMGSDQMFFVLVIHRVEELQPGIYLMPGHGMDQTAIEAVLNKWDGYQDVTDLFEGLCSRSPVYRLKAGKMGRLAATLCCHQPIASDCGFLVSFFAPFNLLNQQGAAAYRYLHWQAGELGHRVYLAASQRQLSATGIGCFFDDPWHELLGLPDSDRGYQTIYQIAVGVDKPDARLTTASAYHHLTEKRRRSCQILPDGTVINE